MANTFQTLLKKAQSLDSILDVVGGQKKKRFWNKWFGKRKNKVSDDASSPSEVIEIPKDSQRSRSTSELSETEEPTRRRNGTPMHPGLSVSHDSVFHSPHSGSEIELEGAQSSSSLSIHHQHHTDRLQTELTERLRLRRGRGDTSEDDEGLPRSPCNSPTATDKTAIKDNPKSHSTCSEASLLSVESSEMDEDSFGQYSQYSSKLSLDEKNTADGDFDLDIGLKNTSAPLNHSGARHKASVKPQRRYGAPRKKRLSGSVLPTTPEVNEETALRSITPEVSSTKEIVTELYSSSTISSSKSMSKTNRTTTLTEKQLKCSSLPPGLAAPGSETSKLNRSRSNAGAKYQDEFAALGEEDEGKDSKKTDSFLGRIFPRRSGKKRKSKEEKIINTSSSALSSSTSVTTTNTNVSKQVEVVETSVKEFSHSERRVETLAVRPIPVPRSGPAARQRIHPNDIPASPELSTRFEDVFKSSPDRHQSASPLQIELESHLQHRLASLSTSPKPSIIKTPPISPKLQRSPLVSPPRSPLSYPKVPLKSHLIEKMNSKHSRSEEIRSKVIITGLSAFQQRAVSNMDEDDSDGFKSLNDLPTEATKPSKLVAKSHSFKINNNNSNYGSPGENKTTFAALASRSTHEIQNSTKSTVVNETSNEFKTEIKKTISLDSIKNLDSVVTHNTEQIFQDVKIRQPEENLAEDRVSKVSQSNSNVCPQKAEAIVNSETKEFMNKTTSTEGKEFSNKVESKEFANKVFTSDVAEFANSGITISGPRHKAIVSVTNHESSMMSETCAKTEVSEIKQVETHKEIKEQISVTKIQVKQESMQISSVAKSTIPEFMNIQLHKVEKPVNNIVLTAGFHSPKTEEQSKMTVNELPDVVAINHQTSNIRSSLEIEKPIESEAQSSENVRKFSKEDIEIIERNEVEDEKKHVTTALVTITTMTPPVPTRIFKKNDFQMRKSLISANNSEKPVLKTKSSSLDIVESIKNSDDAKVEDRNDIKAKTQSVNDLSESANMEPNVPLRRKSMANKQKPEDEPELMKVFARRSLKLKDSESESLSQQVLKMAEESNATDVKSRDSDKENQLDSPAEERKKIVPKDAPKLKEPLLESKFVEATTEVTLRKPPNNNNNNNNKLYNYQRTVSLNNAKTNEFNNYEKVQKQNSFTDRPKTDHWINYKSTDSDPCTKICQEEILTSIVEKTLIEEEFCTKPKNFNQRKAEWEKRAQEASRKTTP